MKVLNDKILLFYDIAFLPLGPLLEERLDVLKIPFRLSTKLAIRLCGELSNFCWTRFTVSVIVKINCTSLCVYGQK